MLLFLSPTDLICFVFEELFEKAFSRRFPEVAFHSKFHNPDSVEDACPYLLHSYLSSHKVEFRRSRNHRAKLATIDDLLDQGLLR